MSNLSREQTRYLVQFLHPEKPYAGLPGQFDDAALAGLFGIDIDAYRSLRDSFMAGVQQAARDLLADAAFTASFDRLPFPPGARVVAVGDSLTDDWQSWFEILRQLFAQRRATDNITFINAGISAETTTEILKRFIEVVWQQPAWIICAAGANDTWFWTDHPLKLSVSLEETGRNLVAMRDYAARRTAARWVWFTPPPMIPELVNSHWYQGAFQMMTSNKDLRAIADLILRQPEPVLDLQTCFGQPVDQAYFLDDGLHPSLAGHQAIVRALVKLLAP